MKKIFFISLIASAVVLSGCALPWQKIAQLQVQKDTSIIPNQSEEAAELLPLMQLDKIDIDKIKRYFIDRYKWDNVQINIVNQDDTHARLLYTLIGYKGAGGSGFFILAKKNGIWLMLTDGGDYTCQSVEKYNFPLGMIDDCNDVVNNLTLTDKEILKENFRKQLQERFNFNTDGYIFDWMQVSGNFLKAQLTSRYNNSEIIFAKKDASNWILLQEPTNKDLGYCCDDFDKYGLPTNLINDCKVIDLGKNTSSVNGTYINSKFNFVFKFNSAWKLSQPSCTERIYGQIVDLINPKTAEDNNKLIAECPSCPFRNNFNIQYWSNINDFADRYAGELNANYKNLADFVKRTKYFGKASEIMVGGINSYEVDVGGEGSQYGIILEHNGIFLLSFSSTDKTFLSSDDKIIINSFKFIK